MEGLEVFSEVVADEVQEDVATLISGGGVEPKPPELVLVKLLGLAQHQYSTH